MGHCGAKQHLNETEESKELNKLLWFGLYACVSDINDGKDKRFKQATPKERILAALESLEK